MGGTCVFEELRVSLKSEAAAVTYRGFLVYTSFVALDLCDRACHGAHFLDAVSDHNYFFQEGVVLFQNNVYAGSAFYRDCLRMP